jgi:O-antigen ligase
MLGPDLAGFWDFLFVFITIAGMPLVFTKRTIEPVLTTRFLLLSLTLLVSLVFIIYRFFRDKSVFDFSLLRRALFPVFLIPILIGGISLFQAINLAEGIFELLKILLFFVFLYVASILLTRNENLVIDISRASMIAALVLSIIGIGQYFDLAFTDIPGNLEIYATMANKNMLSTSFALLVPFLFLGILVSKRIWAVLNIISLITVGFVIGTNQTRSALLALLGSTAFFILTFSLIFKKLEFAQKVKNHYLKRLSYSAVIFAVTIAISTFLPSLKVQKTDKQVNVDVQLEVITRKLTRPSTITERFQMWEKTVPMLKDHPFLGVGPGNWKINLPKYGTEGMRSAEGNVHFLRPHNDFLWVFAETGIFGFLAYLALFGIIFYYGYRIISHTNQPNVKVVTLFMSSGIIGYILISLVTFPRERIVQSILFLMMTAIIAALYHRLFPLKKKISGTAIAVIQFVLLGVLILCILAGYSRLNSEIHTKNSFIAKALKKHQVEVAELNKAETLIYNLDPLATPIALYRGLAVSKLGKMEAALTDLQSAYKAHPYHIHTLSNLATAYERTGNLEKAVEFFNKALEISPRHEHTLLNLTAVYFEMGNYRKAHEVIQRCNPESRNPKIQSYRAAIEKKLGQGPLQQGLE